MAPAKWVFSTAAGANDDQAATGVFGETLGVVIRVLEQSLVLRVLAQAITVKGTKGEAGQGTEIAVAKQAGPSLLLVLLFPADARLHFSKAGMPHRNIHPYVLEVPTDPTSGGWRGLLNERREVLGAGGRPLRLKPFQRVAYLLHGPCLPVPIA